MRELGVEADVGTYSTLVTGLCRAGRVGEAWGVLEWMLEEGCRPMVQTYTPIVQGYCREGRVEDAKELMATMERAGCPPNVVTYNVLIRALCDVARFEEVSHILTESRTKDWTPSTVTYNTFMNGLCKKGMAKEALEQLDVMLGEGLDPTDFTLSILLNCLCHDSRISDAIYLLERSTSLKWYAGVVAYNTVMSRLCGAGYWMGVLKLLTDMIKKGIMPNTRSFNIFFRSLCFGRKFRLVKNLIRNQAFAATANVVTYNTLIYLFYFYGKPIEAEHVKLDMELQKIAPDEVTYTILVDRLCREGKFDTATTLFGNSLEIGLSRDLFAVLTNKLAHNGKIWEMIRVFQEMGKKGFIPDSYIFDLTIRSFCRTGYCHDSKFFKLNFILDTMLEGSELNPCGDLEEPAIIEGNISFYFASNLNLD
jgi:pentatricopeptide repeat protein